MVGKGIYGFYVLQQAGLGGADCQKFSSVYPTFEPELTCPTNMTPKIACSDSSICILSFNREDVPSVQLAVYHSGRAPIFAIPLLLNDAFNGFYGILIAQFSGTLKTGVEMILSEFSSLLFAFFQLVFERGDSGMDQFERHLTGFWKALGFEVAIQIARVRHWRQFV
jgi:hypothetical protein